jgi:hypothetical protein
MHCILYVVQDIGECVLVLFAFVAIGTLPYY